MAKFFVALAALLAIGAAGYFFVFSTSSTSSRGDLGGFETSEDEQAGPDLRAAGAGNGAAGERGSRREDAADTSKRASEDATRVQSTATLKLTLVLDGKPLSEARVLLEKTGRPRAPIDEKHKSKPSDTRGRIVHSDAQPGRYRIAVDHEDVAVEWRSEIFELVGGRTTDLGRLEVEAASGLRGRIVDESGLAIADARISWREREMFGLNESAKFADSGTRSAKDGRFVLTRQRAGARALVVDHDDFRRLVEPTEIASGQYQDLGDLTLHRGRELVGTVQDRDGRPVVRARISPQLRTEIDGQESVYFAHARAVETDRRGAFVIRGLPPKVVVVVQAQGFAPKQVAVEDSERSKQIVLDGTPGVSGVVSGDFGSEASVYLHEIGRDFGRKRVVEVAEGGAFVFDDVKAARYELFADAPGYGASTKRAIEVPAAGLRGLELRIVPGPNLVVDVRDGAGNPVADAKITVRAARTQPTFEGIPRDKNSIPTRNAQADAGGRAEIRGMWTGRTDVRVRADGYIQHESEVVIAQADTRHAVILMRGGFLIGEVVDDIGRPVPRAQVSVRRFEDKPDRGTVVVRAGPGPMPDTVTADESGRFRVGPLRAGPVDAWATWPRVEKRPSGSFVIGELAAPADAVRALVRDGAETSLEIRVARPAAIVGNVRYQGRGLVGARVFAKSDSDAVGSMQLPEAKSDDQGRYRLEGLAAGSWSVAVKPRGGAVPTRAQKVTLSSGVELVHDIDIRGGSVVGQLAMASGAPARSFEKFEIVIRDPDHVYARTQMTLRLGGSGGGAAGESQMNIRSPMQPDPVKPDAQGRFRFDFVPAGKWTLEIFEGKTKRRKDTIEVRDGVLLRLGTIRMSASFPIKLELVDPTGTPLGVAWLAIYREGEPVATRQPILAEVVPNGKVQIAAIEPGRYRIEVKPIGQDAGAPKQKQVGTLVVGPDGRLNDTKLRLER